MKRPRTSSAPFSLPGPLKPLEKVVYNLWWSWTPQAQDLFARMDPGAWETHHNPVKLIRELPQARLAELAADSAFLAELEAVAAVLEQELNRSTWMKEAHSEYHQRLVAYLCTEFGIHESLPIYSGGLGVLAGDHTKSASDIGLPFVGLGLLYRNGYFTQQIDAKGNQVHIYPDTDFDDLPIRPIVDETDRPVRVSVSLPDGEVQIQAWLAEVGRSRIILLDTDFDANPEPFRKITSQLYGGDRDMRISQEIVLGIGGVRMFRRLGIEPEVWHLNEGHVAFSCFERMREYMQEQGLNFEQACEAVRANTVFTTHTPVPAGNEAFSLLQMQRYFRKFAEDAGIPLLRLLRLGLQDEPGGSRYFSMTVLALRLSCRANGVSQLHGRVSQRMWAHIWPEVEPLENPIIGITNGVHTQTWVAREFRDLFRRHLGEDWPRHLAERQYWNRIDAIPDSTFEEVHRILKERLIHFVRERLKAQYRRHGASEAFLQQIDSWLRPDVLTIGFARRFAPYKRAFLILSDLDRLNRLVNHPQHPIQLIFAGKAHPQNEAGQQIIKRIWELAQRPEFLGKVILLENYDMNVARHLVQGVDVWLNNPRRPQEASGTSGQKVPINGGINFSVLDGWWPEAYDGTNGWKIGDPREFDDVNQQDRHDAESLFKTLEEEIIPRYYGRSSGQTWLQTSRASMKSVLPVFNTEVMVRNYFEKMYRPAADRGRALLADGLERLKEFVAFAQQVREVWPLLHFTDVQFDRAFEDGMAKISLSAALYTGDLPADALRVQLAAVSIDPEQPPRVLAELSPEGQSRNQLLRYRFEDRIELNRDDELQLRVMPKHPVFSHPQESGLVYRRELA